MSADPFSRLVSEFARLPGIGPKTAARLAQHVAKSSRSGAEALADAIIAVKDKLRPCSTCYSLTEHDPCPICSDPERDRSKICVVEQPFNIQPLERTREYRGLYHVLMGVLSPQHGVGPDQLRVSDLMARLDGIGEVILAKPRLYISLVCSKIVGSKFHASPSACPWVAISSTPTR